MNITYFPVTLSDVDNLMTIENACHSHPWNQKVFSSCIGGRYFGNYIKDDSQESSQETNSILGFYIGEYVAGEATLMDVCVHPDVQGKGYGKILLQHFIHSAKEKGAEKALLEVRARNISAQMMYINSGFTEIGRRTGYYPSTIGYEDAIVMSSRL